MSASPVQAVMNNHAAGLARQLLTDAAGIPVVRANSRRSDQVEGDGHLAFATPERVLWILLIYWPERCSGSISRMEVLLRYRRGRWG
jgi:hypothetical protein